MRVQVYGGLCNRLRVGTGSRFRNVPMPEKDT